MSTPQEPIRLPNPPSDEPRPAETLVIRLTTFYYFAIAGMFFIAGFIVAWVTFSSMISTSSSNDIKGLQADMASLRSDMNAVTQWIASGAAGSGNSGSDASAPSLPSGPVDIDVSNKPTWGPADAKVTIVEFSDFQCPWCHRYFLETYPLIKATYGDKVRYVFMHTPISSLHPDAERAALASECAREQNKFWEFHDLTFTRQSDLSHDALISYARTAGVSNIDQFTQCLDTAKYLANVQDSLAEADRIGVSGVGTPTFFINGVAVVGAQPWSLFKTRIDSALSASGG